MNIIDILPVALLLIAGFGGFLAIIINDGSYRELNLKPKSKKQPK